MSPADLLTDAFGRVREDVESVLDGLHESALTARPDVAGTEQVWTSQEYHERFGLPFDAGDTGYGHTSDQVGLVQPSADLLRAYHRATHEQTLAFVRTVGPDDLDRVVDTHWDPPVTLGVRWVSVVNDCTQHVGQAAYVRGLLAL